MKSHLVIFALALALGGCASLDRASMTRFEPLGLENGQRAFKYTARADVMYRADNPEAEAQRMQWLQDYLADNGYCPSGYEIKSRELVAINVGLAVVHDIFYQVRCKG